MLAKVLQKFYKSFIHILHSVVILGVKEKKIFELT